MKTATNHNRLVLWRQVHPQIQKHGPGHTQAVSRLPLRLENCHRSEAADYGSIENHGSQTIMDPDPTKD